MDILSKAIILEFIASVGDALPSMEEIDVAFAPVRSGHVAFDGVWFKLKGEQIVLLVAGELGLEPRVFCSKGRRVAITPLPNVQNRLTIKEHG